MDLQEKILRAWDLSAKGYSENIVQDDFVEPGRSIWTKLILEDVPSDTRLKILDVGTGPGVFATILTLAGHDVVGIDISEKMLDEARKNSACHRTSPCYLTMDSQRLTFPENTFDLIVARNVVWIMQEPEAAYDSWLRCLKPGGQIIVFDTAHGAKDFLTEFDTDLSSFIANYRAKFGSNPPLSFEPSQYEEARGWKRDLKLSYVERPAWDVKTLEDLGYVNIRWDDVNAQTSYTKELRFQNQGQVYFRLKARKPLTETKVIQP